MAQKLHREKRSRWKIKGEDSAKWRNKMHEVRNVKGKMEDYGGKYKAKKRCR